MVEEKLYEGTAGGVADQDGRRLELADDRLEMLDDRRHRQRCDRRSVGIERLDLDFEPG